MSCDHQRKQKARLWSINHSTDAAGQASYEVTKDQEQCQNLLETRTS